MFVLSYFYCSRLFLLFLFLGALLSFGQKPFSLFVPSLLAFIILGWAWEKYKPDGWLAFRIGLGFGIGFFGLTLSWIINPFMVNVGQTGWMAPFALFFLVLILATIWAFCFWISSYLGKNKSSAHRLSFLAIFVVIAELLRSEYFFSFPWAIFSAAWINTPLIQSLAIFGPYWLGAITVYCGLIMSRFYVGTIVGVGLLGILYCFGLYSVSIPIEERENPLLIRLVQPNVEQNEKWDPNKAEKFLNILLQLSSQPPLPELIVWPETAVSFLPQEKPEIVRSITDKIKTNLILGARRVDRDNYKIYNSAFFVGADGAIKSYYDKSHLVPFGEYIPLSSFLKKLTWSGLATRGELGFSKGSGGHVKSFLGVPPVLVLICYESIFTNEVDNARLVVADARPEWIVNITNDAWFGQYNGPQQHLDLTRMRAIEQGIPIVRVANTGISAVINSKGTLIGQIEINQRSAIDISLPNRLNYTPYNYLGAKTWNFALIILLILTISYLITRRDLENT